MFKVNEVVAKTGPNRDNYWLFITPVLVQKPCVSLFHGRAYRKEPCAEHVVLEHLGFLRATG